MLKLVGTQKCLIPKRASKWSLLGFAWFLIPKKDLRVSPYLGAHPDFNCLEGDFYLVTVAVKKDNSTDALSYEMPRGILNRGDFQKGYLARPTDETALSILAKLNAAFEDHPQRYSKPKDQIRVLH